MDQASNASANRTRTIVGVVGLLAAGAVTGGILAGTMSASAAGNTTTGVGTAGASNTDVPAAATAPQGAPGQGQAGQPGGPNGRPGGAAPVRSDEKQLTGTQADQVKAAALKAVPGGTVYRVETDAGDGTYEAHMTKADGTPVTVKFDKNLSVTKVEVGMGTGDPRPAGAPSQPSSGSSTPSSSTGA